MDNCWILSEIRQGNLETYKVTVHISFYTSENCYIQGKIILLSYIQSQRRHYLSSVFEGILFRSEVCVISLVSCCNTVI